MSGVAVITLSLIVLTDLSAKTCGSGGGECSLGHGHTMCKYSGPRSGCTPGRLTREQQDEIIKLHNDYRSKVASGKEANSSIPGKNQPPAANMLRLKYDDQLAKVAQRWAEQCTPGHDKNRKDKRFPHVGQNAAQAGSSDPRFKFTVKRGIDAWYNEVKKYNPNAIKPFKFSPQTGHYTQVVWHSTHRVGCGYAYTKGHGVTYYFVCNYAPAGNMLGAMLYEEGSACTKCPKDHPTCSDSLCG